MSKTQQFDSRVFYAKHENKTVFVGISYIDPLDHRVLGHDQIFGTFQVPNPSEEQCICVASDDGLRHFFNPEAASIFEAPPGIYHLHLHASPVEDPDFFWLRDIYAH